MSCGDLIACSRAYIEGGTDSILNVTCGYEDACEYMVIDGRDATSLALNDCSESLSCFAMEIWCPPNQNGIAMCIVKGNQLGGSDTNPMRIYAQNSWDELRSRI